MGTPHFGLGQLFVQYFRKSKLSFSSESLFFLTMLTIDSVFLNSSNISSLLIMHLLNGWTLSLQSRQKWKSQNVHFPEFCSCSIIANYLHVDKGHQPISLIYSIAFSTDNFSYFYSSSLSSFRFFMSLSANCFLHDFSAQMSFAIYPSFNFCSTID